MSAMKNTNGMAMEAFSKAGDLHKRISSRLLPYFSIALERSFRCLVSIRMF